ncbi:diguanylate cyclase [Mycoplasmatota bacterium WC44]
MFSHINEEDYRIIYSFEETVETLLNKDVKYAIVFKWQYEQYLREISEMQNQKDILYPVMELYEELYSGISVNEKYKNADLLIDIMNVIFPLIEYERYENKILDTHIDNYLLLNGDIELKSDAKLVFIVGSITLIVLSLYTQSYYIKRDRIEELEKNAIFDHLTNLKNRNALSQDYESRDLKGLYFIFVDIDDFKAANDKYGRDTGDFILVEIAERIIKVSNIADIYRIGGDEFLIITDSLNNDYVDDLTAAIKEPINHDSIEYSVTVSAGVIRIDDFNITELTDAINLADYMMLKAKTEGKNVFLKAEDKYLREFEINKEAKKKIFEAIKRKEFIPHFQPIFDIGSSKVIGYETLARWYSDEGLIPAIEFISTAINSGLIYNIDLLMFEENIKFIKELSELNLITDDFVFTSNMSSYTLSSLKVEN